MPQNELDEQQIAQIICNFINDPDKQVKLSEIQNIFQIITQCCKKKQKINLYLHGSILCFICNQETNSNSHILQCGHSVHQQCYEIYAYKLNPSFDPSNYKYLVCTKDKYCKNFPPTQKFIEQIFGSKNISIIMDHINLIAIKQIQKKEQDEKNYQNQQKTFNCQICTDDKLIRSEACTLDCDHRFCFECVGDNINEQVNQGKYQANELICPQDKCQIPIDINIIQGISKTIYNRILDLRYQNMETNDPSIKILRCPGTYKQTTAGEILPIDRREGYQKLAVQQTQLDQHQDMNISRIKQADGCYMSCTYMFEVNINNTKVIKCQKCTCKFCVFCYEDDHPNLTCQQYKEWKDLNNKADEEFTKYIEKMKMRKCPKCESWIYKIRGCNHITCGLKTCKHQFCYICGADWAPQRKCTCGQYDKVNDVSDV